MKLKDYIVATIKPWNVRVYHEVIKKYPGRWHLVTAPDQLTVSLVDKLQPAYIFFPHWSVTVPKEILTRAECIGFHMTDLPFGRGGSPLQNLIQRGCRETMVSAIRLTEKFDAGPVYLKQALSLEGLAEEIFVRSADVIAAIILKIVKTKPVPRKQVGPGTVFKRRSPAESEVTQEVKSLKELFDFIRMLDASGYPRAYIKYNNYKIEFSRPALRARGIQADVNIALSDGDDHDQT